MENLLKPDLGLMLWTVVTFLIMVGILKKVAWGPLLKTLDQRELKVKHDVETAEQNRLEMERLKQSYSDQISKINQQAAELLKQAQLQSKSAQESILKETEIQARDILEKSRQQIEIERVRLVQDLRNEVGQLSVLAAEKLLGRSVDSQTRDTFFQECIQNLEIAKK